MDDDPARHGWLPCPACGSHRHYLDDCDTPGAMAAYYDADEDDPDDDGRPVVTVELPGISR